MVPEERTKIVKECSMQPEERTKTVKECTMVAEERTKIVKVMSCEDEVRTRVVKQCVMIDEVRTKTIQKQVAVASGCGIAYAVPACGFGHGCKKARACCVAPVCACSGEVIYGDLPDAPAFLGDNDEVDAPAFDADEYADTEEKDTISTEDTEEDALPSVY